MRFGRTIVVLAVALSVAILPVAFVGAAGAPSVQITDSGATDDCCAHEPSCDTSSNPMKRCAAVVACAAMCLGFTGLALVGMTLGATGSTFDPIWTENLYLSQIGCPPFRPPRV